MTFSMARSDFGWERSNWERFDNGIRQDFKYLLDKIMYQNYLHLIASFCVTASNILSNKPKHRKKNSKKEFY